MASAITMKSLALTNIVAGVLVAVLLLARFVSPWAQSHYRPEPPAENWSTLILKDPQLNSVITSIPSTGAFQALLVINDCGQCNGSKVAAFSAVGIGHNAQRLVLVANDISATEAEHRFGHFSNIQFKTLKLRQKVELNVSFLPRVYIVDQHCRVVFIQPPSYSCGQAFWSIQKMVKKA